MSRKQVLRELGEMVLPFDVEEPQRAAHVFVARALYLLPSRQHEKFLSHLECSIAHFRRVLAGEVREREPIHVEGCPHYVSPEELREQSKLRTDDWIRFTNETDGDIEAAREKMREAGWE